MIHLGQAKFVIRNLQKKLTQAQKANEVLTENVDRLETDLNILDERRQKENKAAYELGYDDAIRHTKEEL